jgi:ribosome biogenesis GTPase
LTVSHAPLVPYGWNARWEALFTEARDQRREDNSACLPGRVARHDGVAVTVITDDGPRALPVFAMVDPQPIVGDWVVCTTDVVVATLPRTSLLRRQDPEKPVEQALVANVDMVLVVCGLDRPVRAGRIRRAVATAWEAGAVPVVVLAKADRVSAKELDAAREEATESGPGVDVLTTSAVTGLGIDELRALAVDKTLVLMGESGAGKSSLTNALIGEDVAVVGDVRSVDAKGRHTTTTRQLHLLPTGGVLVDTPGVRALALWTDPDAVAETFDEVEELALQCRFSDCRHDGEPGCAVVAAVASGELPAARFEAWVALRREAEAIARRSDPQAMRTYGRHFARVTKDAQKRKGR